MSSLDGLTSGISTTITFVSPTSGIQKFAILESFSSAEDASVMREIGIDGTSRHPKLSQGWSGSFTVQRGSSFLDDYIADNERNYLLGGDQINLTITQTIKEIDQSTSQYQYTGVVITLTDAGTYSGTDIVKQSASFMAARRIKK